MVGPWSYEPLELARFPPGEGPFGVQGMAFVTALHYVERRLPGGRNALAAALGVGSAVATYCKQTFDPSESYDASILLRILSAAAKIAHAPIGRFIEARSRWSATTERHGVLKTLAGAPPEAMAKRLHLDF